MPVISPAMSPCISALRFAYVVVRKGWTRRSRFDRGNGDPYVRITRRSRSMPRRSAYISAGNRVPDIRTLAWTWPNTRLLRTLGSIRRNANLPSAPGRTRRRIPSSWSRHRARNSATDGSDDGTPRRTASAAETRQGSAEDIADLVVVVAHAELRPRGCVHRDLVRADTARAARADELLDVQGPLEDCGDHRGIVAREVRARPRLHLQVAELVERTPEGRRVLLEAHRLFRDQVHRRDSGSLRLDSPHGLDRDPVMALSRREEEDELVRAERDLQGCDERDRGLADSRRRVGEQVSSVRERPTRVREEVRLARTDPLERPRDQEGWRSDGCRGLERVDHRPPQSDCCRRRQGMKDFRRGRAETTRGPRR